jgi:hypothetical protein
MHINLHFVCALVPEWVLEALKDIEPVTMIGLGISKLCTSKTDGRQ